MKENKQRKIMLVISKRTTEFIRSVDPFFIVLLHTKRISIALDKNDSKRKQRATIYPLLDSKLLKDTSIVSALSIPLLSSADELMYALVCLLFASEEAPSKRR